MTRLITLMLCLLFMLNLAAANAGMSEEQMQEMMKQAQEMQKCMADIDPATMKSLETRGKKLQAEVKQLCADGKRDEAQQTAIESGREMANSREMKAIQQCGELARKLTQQIQLNTEEGSNKHICDEL